MTHAELTDRAARWCDAAGIPRPEVWEEDDGSVTLYWHRLGFAAHCMADGEFWWHDYRSVTTDAVASASLIAAIKKEMDA